MFLLLRPTPVFELCIESRQFALLAAGPIFGVQAKIQRFDFICQLVEFALCHCNLVERIDVLFSEREYTLELARLIEVLCDEVAVINQRL